MSGPATSSIQSRSPLLHAWHDPLAGIKTHSSCVKLADLNCDGDSKLCIVDYDMKMRIYQGTQMIMDYTILDVPVALCVTYLDNAMPRIPSLAVAAGSHVFLYRQLRPYRRWTCPPIDIPPLEVDIWNDIKSGSVTPLAAVKRLTEARDGGVVLSARSAELLALSNDAERVQFINEMRDVSYQQQTLITCMETLKKDSEELDAVSLLIVGTEAGQLLILPQDPINSNVLCKVQLPSPPHLLVTWGVFDVEWRVAVLCRGGRGGGGGGGGGIFIVKNGDVRGSACLVGCIVDLPSPPVCVCKGGEKNLWVGGMDRVVSCYSARGKKLHSMQMTGDVSEMCVMNLRGAKLPPLLLVGLVGGEVCLYREMKKIHSFNIDAPLTGMIYGSYGREENCLILIHGGGLGSSGGGGLTIKIWRRTAELDNFNFSSGPPPEQDLPLPVPKKTKLYVEQTARERERGGEMHRAFQKDLCKLRLNTARSYVKTLTEGGMMNTSSMGNQDIRLQASVAGLGPRFFLRLTLQNTSSGGGAAGSGLGGALLNTRIVVLFDERMYSMTSPQGGGQILSVPVLLPGPKHILEAPITCIDPMGRGGSVMVLVYSGGLGGEGSVSCAPMLSAQVKMPPSEPSLF